MAELKWTARHTRAVLLVAEDALTDADIAAQIGVSKTTLETWKKIPVFQQKLDETIAEMSAALLRHGIARLDRRLARYNKTWQDIQTVIAERALDMGEDCPGSKTGLMVLQKKGLGGGDNFRVVDEYVLDTGLLAELRALEMQAAKELGQWTEKRDLTTKGEALNLAFGDEELDERITQLEKRKAAKAVSELP